MGIEIVVFEVWKRIGVRTIDQDQLQPVSEPVEGKRRLSRTFHECDSLTAQKWRGFDRSDAVGPAIHREDRVVLAQMRQEERAGAGPRFNRVLHRPHGCVTNNGLERSSGKRAGLVKRRRDPDDL